MWRYPKTSSLSPGLVIESKNFTRSFKATARSLWTTLLCTHLSFSATWCTCCCRRKCCFKLEGWGVSFLNLSESKRSKMFLSQKPTETLRRLEGWMNNTKCRIFFVVRSHMNHRLGLFCLDECFPSSNTLKYDDKDKPHSNAIQRSQVPKWQCLFFYRSGFFSLQNLAWQWLLP